MNDSSNATDPSEKGKSNEDGATMTMTHWQHVFSGKETVTFPVPVASGILIVTILLTCCCTLFVRHKITKCFRHIVKRKKDKKSV